MNYWAVVDALFADGHYVEDWELKRFGQFASEVQLFIRSEAAVGNKIQSIAFPTIFLSTPPSTGVLNLPKGLCFMCPLQHTGTRVYDGDEDGVIVHLESGARIYLSGRELPWAPPETASSFPSNDA